MDDRTMLEMAAKAAGVSDVDLVGRPCVLVIKDSGIHQRCWNPLTDDGDALRLAVTIGVDVLLQGRKLAQVVAKGVYADEPYAKDPCAATRRAITRAAAEIGKAMKEADK